MTKTIIYCDHCGKEIDSMEDYVDINIELWSTTFYTDLCHECYEELVRKVERFCKKDEE